jgi:hypothetical protein
MVVQSSDLLIPWCCSGLLASVERTQQPRLQRLKHFSALFAATVFAEASYWIGDGYQTLSELLARERYVTVVGVGNICKAGVGAMHVCRAGVNSCGTPRSCVCMELLTVGHEAYVEGRLSGSPSSVGWLVRCTVPCGPVGIDNNYC